MIERNNTFIERSLQKKRSILILGPRGSGKTFYIQDLLTAFAKTFTVDLLDNALFLRYLRRPELLTKELKLKVSDGEVLYVFIDEIQRVPLLLNEVHRSIELYTDKVVFILTGSSARKLKSQGTNLLAGRALYMPFFPINIFEIDSDKYLQKLIQFGSLPTVITENDPEMIKEYLNSYTYMYLKEEILQESIVRNLDLFSRFLEIAAFENGMPVNCSKIGKQIGITSATIKSHYQILEDTLLVTKIPSWTYSVRKQLQRNAKYYFFDNGIINALTGELSTELRESSYRYGRLFENMVVNEIIRYNTIKRYHWKLYHYRTNHGVEIDLIIQKNLKATPIAVEIKSGEQPDKKDVKQFKTFLDEYPDAKCFVLCNTPTAYQDDYVMFYPFKEGIVEIFNC